MWRQSILLAEEAKCLKHTGHLRVSGAVACTALCTFAIVVALTEEGERGTAVVTDKGSRLAAADKVGPDTEVAIIGERQASGPPADSVAITESDVGVK